jgi:hypothetical protein
MRADTSEELKAQEGYNARERRALAVRGGTDVVPLPSWMSGSQAAGRGGNSECATAYPMYPTAYAVLLLRTARVLHGTAWPMCLYHVSKNVCGSGAARGACNF